MSPVDFTDELWLFLSPWCEEEKVEDDDYADAFAVAWAALWNYTIDSRTMTTAKIEAICGGLFNVPTDELIDILRKRREVFFPDDNRLIERFRVVPTEEGFAIYVVFVGQR